MCHAYMDLVGKQGEGQSKWVKAYKVGKNGRAPFKICAVGSNLLYSISEENLSVKLFSKFL